MTATQQFIEDAIEGGWTVQRSYYASPVKFLRLKHFNDQYTTIEIDDTTMVENEGVEAEVQVTTTHQTCSILLDPLTWQAVGKTRGWRPDYKDIDAFGRERIMSETRTRLHAFIDHLADGDDIETALSKLVCH